MADTEMAKVGGATTAAVLSVFFVGQAAFIVNPAISGIAAMYPSIPLSTITYVATMVSLACIPFSLVAGSIAGTKIRYKTLAIIAIVLITGGGTLAYFTAGSFPALLATRCLVGAGIGMATPIGNAVIMKIYNGKQQATMQGLGMAVQNIAGVLLQLISGAIVGVNISYCWLLHLIMVIPLILVVLFFKEPAQDAAAPVKSESAAPAAKAKLPILVVIFSAAYGLMFIFYYPLLLNMSSIVTGEGIGTAALAGTIGSMYSIGGMVAGFGFGPIYKALGRKLVIPVCMVLIVASMALAYFTTSPILLMAAVLVSGIAVFVIWPACMVIFGEICPPERMAFASGLFFALLNVGGFLASPVMGIIASATGSANPRTPLIVGAVAVAIITVIWSVICIGKKAPVATASENN